MLIGFRRFDAEHRRGGKVHDPLPVPPPVEAADQGNGGIFALDDPCGGSVDSRLPGECKSEDLTLRDSALIRDAWELADCQRAIFVDDGAFRAQAAERGTSTPQIGQVGSSLFFRLDGTRGAEQTP
jgi:hypothetical protein